MRPSPPHDWKKAGLPYIQNFSPKDYKADPQNLKIVQDERGIMYFGSLLTYDGVSWCLLKTANKTVVRSLCIPPGENRIYVGCFGEFGYFAPDGSGSLMFTSLMEHIPEENRKFQDV